MWVQQCSTMMDSEFILYIHNYLIEVYGYADSYALFTLRSISKEIYKQECE